IGGRTVPCLVVGSALYPLRELAADMGQARATELFADWTASRARLGELAKLAPSRSGIPIPDADLVAPVTHPGTLISAGANYYAHRAEMGFRDVQKQTQRLFFFFKPPRHAIVGPGETIEMPRDTRMFDWEIELAVIIGTRARYVSAAEALDHVAGYTVAIDLSARDFNRAPDQLYKFDWVAGKA